MTPPDTPTEQASELYEAVADTAWLLTIAHHPVPAHAGRRIVVPEDEDLVLGRKSDAFGPGALNDSRVSRRHLELRWRGEELLARDLGSRNGTLINGSPVHQQRVEDGDVLTMGNILLLAHRGPRLSTMPSHPRLVGVSAAMASVIHRIAIAAPNDVTVLIRGETGVGKELVARELHEQSGRSGPFVAINCGAVPDGVVHSELFGHEKGAFSGATGRREGLVATADSGTLFLDEIGDASASLQASLLRLLEQREYRPVGSDAFRSSTARFVAATHVPLIGAVEAGSFRADLHARLNRWTIDLPPLRERRDDIMPLAHRFAQLCAGTPVRTDRALAHALLRYGWPANVRELQSVMEQAVLEAAGREVLSLSEELAQRLADPAAAAGAAAPSSASRNTRGVARARPDAQSLRERFQALGCNARALADELGVGRSTLYRWFQQAGIDPKDLR